MYHLIYSTYKNWIMISRELQKDDLNNLIVGLSMVVGLWLILFILQGVGLYKMAKNKKMAKKWLVFVPIANIYYICKIAGSCDIFGRKIKHFGLYVMIAQIVSSVLCIMAIASEIYLYATCGAPTPVEGTYQYSWSGLHGASLSVYRLYELCEYVVFFVGFLSQILIYLLYSSLFKKYVPQNYMMLSLLVWFVPVAPYVTVFALRNRKEIDFAAYMRAKQEAFFRQQQQYRNMYGNPNNPNNPYGTYTWGPTPNGQNPYARNTSQTNEKKPEDEPFSEFSSNKKPEKDSSHSNENGDGFFD